MPEHDVIVIGGGPAGSTAASFLSRLGHSVLLLEKEKFPRDHVGESLLPCCYSLFEDLGVRETMDRRFVRKPGVRFIDRTGTLSTTWCFSHVIRNESYLSYHVTRRDFDQMLLENSRRLGAEVREQTRVSDVHLGDPDCVTVESVDASGREVLHTSRFVIDASGRDSFLAARNGWRKPREELDRSAFWAHWDGVKMQGGLEEGLAFIIYMGQEKKGWIWVFPLTDTRITIGVVLQNSYIREQRRALQAKGSSDWKTDLTLQELMMSPIVASLLDGATRTLPVQTSGNYSYEVQNSRGPNYAMIGDARGFIDPIFSSGVFLSMKTASLVSNAVHEHLEKGPAAGDEALEAAYRTVVGAYDFVHRMIRLFYNPHATTWAEVGAEREIHRAHESAMAAGHQILSGDFFEAHERYSEFFKLLEDPGSFARYKKLVLDRASFSKNTCKMTREEVFPR